jgi:hypothetical protein
MNRLQKCIAVACCIATPLFGASAPGAQIESLRSAVAAHVTAQIGSSPATTADVAEAEGKLADLLDVDPAVPEAEQY